ncbi:response regulator [Flaviaesturariibacter amylovorans]|uniref:Response regulatory domain-containing protein n=1 Tax=Flaviaesturariibacter amylovorans TaxID=1084520 RepID=A0ABP8HTZ8_9BACT
MTPPKLVLYADDDADDRYIMASMFEAHSDLELLTFSNGKELISFLDHVDREVICGIILDQNMPMMDGMETLLEIRKRQAFQSTPAIVYSTNEFTGSNRRPLNFNGRFIQKPNTFQQIKAVVDQISELFRQS